MLKKHIIVDNLKITYYRSDILNHKNTLIFLHGWGSQAIHFMNILKRCNNFIAFDLPGFGASERPKETWGLIEYSKFLKKFLKKLNIDNPILIGHSFGGSIIIKFCSLKLAKIKKIILIDSAGLRLGGVKIKVYKYLTKILKIPFLLPGLKKFKNSIRKKYYKAIDSTDYINLKNIKDIYLKIIDPNLGFIDNEREFNSIFTKEIG